MAVYERSWRRYDGPLAGRAARFLVVPRYALAEVLRSRAFIVLYLLCFVPALVCLILIYLAHNVAALALLGLTAEKVQQAVPIGVTFFNGYLRIVGMLAFLLAVVVGPALISPDLRNNGLALYLARPFSRSAYVLGKLAVLALLMSAITWVCGLGLFLFQGYLAGGGWMAAQWRVALALFAGSWVWIALLSLLTLAVAAWVKWKPLARIVLLMLFFVLSGFAKILQLVLGVSWGGLLSMSQVIETIWAGLFGADAPSGLPLAGAWAALLLAMAVCLGLLMRRVRAYEVVR
jgi:ABC-type transport system involved in multi-copper enzyme maturation permease subunit